MEQQISQRDRPDTEGEIRVRSPVHPSSSGLLWNFMLANIERHLSEGKAEVEAIRSSESLFAMFEIIRIKSQDGSECFHRDGLEDVKIDSAVRSISLIFLGREARQCNNSSAW